MRLGLPSPTSRSASARATPRAAERRALATPAAGHPDHHARVAVPDAHLGRPGRRCAGRDGDPRRGARRRRHQARRPPGAVTRSGSTSCWSGPPSGSGCPRPCARSRRSPGSCRRGRRSRSSRRRPPRSSTSPSWSRSRTWASWAARRSTGTRAAPGAQSAVDLAARRGAGRRPGRRRTAPPSSSPTPAGWPSACATGSTRSRTSGARLALEDEPVADERCPGRPPAELMGQAGRGARAHRRCSPARTTARSPRSSAP